MLYARRQRQRSRQRLDPNLYLYQYILLAGFVCLLFNKETRFASIVFLTGWAVYLYATIGASSLFYYGASATIEAAIGFVLNRKYRLVSYINYLLIFVNIFGLILWKNKVSPASYDIIYAILSVTQLLLLIIRANVNGIYRLHPKHFMVRCVDFDSCKARVIMCKDKATKETNR